ncbi:MAG: radical SAM protein [Planctomycetes bacterium]|nr:radical SAM protein [Planctomycetota bacterium]
MFQKLKKRLRTFSQRKIYNLFMCRVQTAIGSDRLYYYPTKITIESGNICNLSCPLCPTGQRDGSAKKGFLAYSDFQKLIDEIGENLLVIRLYNWGEPLLNKELIRMVEYADKKKIAVKISTNLSFPVGDKLAESLMKCNLEKIYVSCNGVSGASYSTYHIDGDFDRVIANMRLLVEKKRNLNNTYTELVWLFHVFKHNEHEIDAAKAKAKDVGVRLIINKMRTDMGKEIFETSEKSRERDAEWLPSNPDFNIFDAEGKQPGKRAHCDLLWTETVINWEGSVLPCCSVYSEAHSFGNIKESSFKEIWNNEKYRSARKEVGNRRNGVKTICHICKMNGYL